MIILNRESYTILKTGLRKNIYFHVNLKKKKPTVQSFESI
jgi:hypothetical protein